jgi:hypothetical protein
MTSVSSICEDFFRQTADFGGECALDMHIHTFSWRLMWLDLRLDLFLQCPKIFQVEMCDVGNLQG